MNVSAPIARHLLDRNDPDPGIPQKGQLFMSFLIAKNLTDLCQTGRAILNEMKDSKLPVEGLPSIGTLNLIESVLRQFYSEKMFIPDEEYSQRPDWKVIASFSKENTRAAFQLYRIISRNVKTATEMPKALRDRNKKFFLENIDEVFADVPMKDLINQFKNFIGSGYVPKASQEQIWDFFETLIQLIMDDEENIKLVETL